jgi:hypothetical protein
MCESIYYHHLGTDIRQVFPNPTAVLPVKLKRGAILLPWGRRQTQAGVLPLGGWARLDSIHAGRWDRFFPKSVKLPVASFMQRDIEGREHWYELIKGQYIQGLVAREGQERRVYIVTITPEAEDAIHERWPRIVSEVLFS